MFAFIDESGHTGKRIDIARQPVFSTLAIVAKTNADVAARSKLGEICRAIGAEELHAAELGDTIDDIALEVHRVLQSLSPVFVVSEVDKEFLALAKLFDTIFDSGENLGARNHVYSLRPLRLLLLYKLGSIIGARDAFDFYQDCLFADNQDLADTALIKTCDAILSAVPHLPDSRSRELITDAVSWARSNPRRLTTYNTRKVDRWRHLPNVVPFLPMLSTLATLAAERKTRIMKVIHDEQQQMQVVFQEIHKVASDKTRPPSVTLQDNGSLVFENIKESVFEMKSSASSAGLQLADLCLYMFAHRKQILSSRSTRPASVLLLSYVLQRSRYFDFTLTGFQNEAEQLYQKIMSVDPKDEDLTRAGKVLESLEQRWRNSLGTKATPSNNDLEAP